MNAYQGRVLAEQKQLQSRINSLSFFLKIGDFEKVSEREVFLLRHQLRLMEAYSEILAERVSFFRPD